MKPGYDLPGWNGPDVALDASTAQKDYEFNPGRFERLDAGSHVVGGIADHVNECAFRATFFHGSMDCFGLGEVSLDPLETALLFLVGAETRDGFLGISHGEKHRLCAIVVDTASDGRADVACWAEDYNIVSGHDSLVLHYDC